MKNLVKNVIKGCQTEYDIEEIALIENTHVFYSGHIENFLENCDPVMVQFRNALLNKSVHSKFILNNRKLFIFLEDENDLGGWIIAEEENPAKDGLYWVVFSDRTMEQCQYTMYGRQGQWEPSPTQVIEHNERNKFNGMGENTNLVVWAWYPGPDEPDYDKIAKRGT